MRGEFNVEPPQAVRRTFSETAQWCEKSQFVRVKLLSLSGVVFCQGLVRKLSQ